MKNVEAVDYPPVAREKFSNRRNKLFRREFRLEISDAKLAASLSGCVPPSIVHQCSPEVDLVVKLSPSERTLTDAFGKVS